MRFSCTTKVLVCVGIIFGFIVPLSNLAANTTSAIGIENHRWRIAKYRSDGTQKSNEQGLIDTTIPAKITLAKGEVYGSAGCGALVGTYTLFSKRLINIKADFVLAGLCSYEESAQNQLILTALKGDLRIDEKDDYFLLRDTSGKARVLLN
jgi:heat shock protein HslJ